jgi:hypothetical protein
VAVAGGGDGGGGGGGRDDKRETEEWMCEKVVNKGMNPTTSVLV